MKLSYVLNYLDEYHMDLTPSVRSRNNGIAKGDLTLTLYIVPLHY